MPRRRPPARRRGDGGLRPLSDILTDAVDDPDVHPAIRATIAGELMRHKKGKPPSHEPHPDCPCIECHRALSTVP